MKIFYKESCGCCWHFTLLFNLFGFGVKDSQAYVVFLGKVFWLKLNHSIK